MGDEVTEDLLKAFTAVLMHEEPVSLECDRVFATPNEAYSAFVDLVKRTFPAEKQRMLMDTLGKDTIDEVLSVDFVFSVAMSELLERFNLPRDPGGE